jgi:hypothetical protein
VVEHHELATLGALLLLAETCAELADKSHAPLLYQRLLPFEDMMAAPFLATIVQGPIAHGLGLLAALLDEPGPAERHFRHALATATALRSPPMIATTSERLGALLLSRSSPVERKRGLQLVEDASEIAERIGLKVVARSCIELRRLHGRSSRSEPRPSSHNR